MSQTLNIIIRVKESGLKVVDEVVKKLQDLNKAVAATKSEPLQQVAKSTKEISEGFREVSKVIEEIEGRLGNLEDIIGSVVESVARQTMNIAGETFDRIEDRTETLIARLVTITTAGVATLGFLAFFDDVNDFIFSTRSAIIDLGFVGAEAVGNTVRTVFEALPLFGQIENIITGLNNRIFDIAKLFESTFIVTRLFNNQLLLMLTRTTLIGGTLLIYRSFFRESLILGKRLLGISANAATPLQRISRIIVTMDESLQRFTLQWGEIARTTGLLALTLGSIVAGPFAVLLTGVPFLNSLLDTIGKTFQKGRVRFLAFMGSSRAQFQLIFLQGREFLQLMLGGFEKFKRGLPDLSISKLIIEFRLVSREITTSLRELTLTLQMVFKLSDSQITNIRQRSGETIKGIDQSVAVLMTKINRGFFGRMLDRIKGAFVGAKNILGAAGRAIGLGARRPARPTLGAQGAQAEQQSKKTQTAQQKQAKTTTELGEATAKTAMVTAELNQQIMATTQTAVMSAKAAVVVRRERVANAEIIKVAIASLVSFREAVARDIRAIFDLRRAIALNSEKFFAFNNSLQVTSGRIITVAEQVAKGEKTFFDLQKLIFGVVKGLQEFNKQFGASPALFGNIIKAIQNQMARGFKFNPEQVKKSFQGLDLILKQLESKLIIRGKDAGSKFRSALAQGFQQPEDVQKAVDALARLIADFLVPESPPKRGALRKIDKAGIKLTQMIAAGMRSGMDATNKAAKSIAEGIANYFPRSLPLVGPLIKLPMMGLQIPLFIAMGIKKGASAAIDAATRLAQAIAEPIQRAIDIDLLAERVGISVELLSSLDFALKTVGASADEMSFAFARINETLSKTLSKEEIDKFKSLGLNIDEIKSANEPVLAFMLEVSDIIKDLSPRSERYRKVLETLGLTANSKVVNALRMGRAEILKLQKQGVNLGVTIDKNFASTARQLNSIWARFKSIRDTFINDFLQQIIPTLVDGGNKVLEIVGENRSKIQAVLQIAGQGILKIGKIIKAVVVIAAKEPKKLFDIAKAFAAALFNLVTGLWDDFRGNIFRLMASLMLDMGKLILKSAWEITKALSAQSWAFVKSFGVEVLKFVAGKFAQLLVSVTDIFRKFITEFSRLFHGPAIQALAGLSPKFAKIRDFFEETSAKAEIFTRKLKAMSAAITFDKDKIFRDVAKVTMESLKSIRSISEEFADIVSEKSKDKAKKRFETLLQELSASVKGTKLEGLGAELFSLFTAEKFDAVVKKIDQLKEKIKEPLKELEKQGKKTAEAMGASFEAMAEGIKQRFEKLAMDERTRREAMLGAQAELGDREAQEQLEILRLENRLQQELEAFRAASASKVEIAEFEAAQRDLIAKKAREQEQAALAATFQVIQQGVGATEQIFGDLYELSGRRIKEFFLAEKAAAAARVTISIAEAVAKALAAEGIAGIISGALIAAQGVVQLGKIAATTIKGFAEGGIIREGTTATADDVTIRASRGEGILPTKVMGAIGERAFESMRRGDIASALSQMAGRITMPALNFNPNIPTAAYKPKTGHYQTGGIVTQAAQQQQRPIQIVNVPDREMVTDYLASTAGAEVLVNVISNNAEEVRNALAQ